MRTTAWFIIVSGIGLSIASTGQAADERLTRTAGPAKAALQAKPVVTSSSPVVRIERASKVVQPSVKAEVVNARTPRVAVSPRDATAAIQDNVIQDRRTSRTVAPVALALPRGNAMSQRLEARRPDGSQRAAGFVGRVVPVASIEKPASINVDSTR